MKADGTGCPVRFLLLVIEQSRRQPVIDSKLLTAKSSRNATLSQREQLKACIFIMVKRW